MIRQPRFRRSLNDVDADTADLASDRAGVIGRRLADYRADRALVERAILPLATSLDGRTFTFQASLDGLELETGQYVEIDNGARVRLGQVHGIRVETVSASDTGQVGDLSGMMIRLAVGEGVVLDAGTGTFHDAHVRPAKDDAVAAWFEKHRSDRELVDIGALLLAPDVPASLDAGGFGRHTFLCGQSGSGKTHALGVILEGLLARTGIRIVILDPNSDFVRLADVRPDADTGLAASYAAAAEHISVWRGEEQGGSPLRLRFADVDAPGRAALLGLDPVADREEYAALQELLETQQAGRPLIGSAEELATSSAPGAHALGLRATNLGVTGWWIWSGGEGRSLVTELEEPSARCLVVDLGSLDTPEEQRVIAETVLSTLWRRRNRREPTLIVIDEAHNVCPASPPDPVSGLATRLAVQIAAEGRKFGLYLLTSTQRPQKLHPDVISQCDNLLLMRLNSEADQAFLRGVFSFVPQALLDRVTAFRQGHGLVAGGFVPHPTYVRFGERISEEGGADVPSTWASASP
jgi:DNA helicase HerA-like ATPase